MFRLGVFALLSEFPFDLALFGTAVDWGHQNVFFTLLIGLVVLCLMEKFETNPYAQIAAIAAGMGLAWLLKSDYSYHGVLLIAILYFFPILPGAYDSCRLYQSALGSACLPGIYSDQSLQ